MKATKKLFLNNELPSQTIRSARLSAAGSSAHICMKLIAVSAVKLDIIDLGHDPVILIAIRVPGFETQGPLFIKRFSKFFCDAHLTQPVHTANKRLAR
jgi:hypothetical protein